MIRKPCWGTLVITWRGECGGGYQCYSHGSSCPAAPRPVLLSLLDSENGEAHGLLIEGWLWQGHVVLCWASLEPSWRGSLARAEPSSPVPETCRRLSGISRGEPSPRDAQLQMPCEHLLYCPVSSSGATIRGTCISLFLSQGSKNVAGTLISDVALLPIFKDLPSLCPPPDT